MVEPRPDEKERVKDDAAPVGSVPRGQTGSKTSRRDVRVVVLCSAFVAGMLGMSYAAVPLYELFCQVTGYGGTTKRVEQYSDVVLDRSMSVRFDANVASGLGWSFAPVEREVEMKIGEAVEVRYMATNTGERTSYGQATFNVTPQSAGAYFNKVECFCFTETALEPGESMEMPVVFFIDPAIVEAVETRNIGTITLSYTFFPHEPARPVDEVGNAENTLPDTMKRKDL